MKLTLSIITTIGILAISCFSKSAFAQASASGQVSATIVTPMTVEKLADLEFNNVRLDQNDVSKSEKGSRARKHQKAAEVKTTTVKAASFTLSGKANVAYGITMPATVSKSVGDYTVIIGTSVSANYALNARGTDALSIAGTISVSKEPMMATQTSQDEDETGFCDFPVTIVYN